MATRDLMRVFRAAVIYGVGAERDQPASAESVSESALVLHEVVARGALHPRRIAGEPEPGIACPKRLLFALEPYLDHARSIEAAPGRVPLFRVADLDLSFGQASAKFGNSLDHQLFRAARVQRPRRDPQAGFVCAQAGSEIGHQPFDQVLAGAIDVAGMCAPRKLLDARKNSLVLLLMSHTARRRTGGGYNNYKSASLVLVMRTQVHPVSLHTR